MSYLDESLAPGERIVARFALHWTAKGRLILGIVLIPIVIGIFITIYEWLRLRGIELGVTTHRVVSKTGIVGRETEEIRLSAVETVDLLQTTWGRMLGYGNVRVTGRGESSLLFVRVADPVAVKRAIETAYSANIEQTSGKTPMIKAILTDIEGTTSSISFVKDTLFPYARKHLPAFVVTHTDDTAVQHWLHEAAKEAGIVSATQDEIIAMLQRWIDEDRKSTALKALQGMIWEEGYRSGEFRAHVYPDAAPTLQAWRDRGTEPVRVFVGLGAGAETLLRILRSGRYHAAVLGLFRYGNRCETQCGFVSAHRR